MKSRNPRWKQFWTYLTYPDIPFIRAGKKQIETKRLQNLKKKDKMYVHDWLIRIKENNRRQKRGKYDNIK